MNEWNPTPSYNVFNDFSSGKANDWMFDTIETKQNEFQEPAQSYKVPILEKKSYH